MFFKKNNNIKMLCLKPINKELRRPSVVTLCIQKLKCNVSKSSSLLLQRQYCLAIMYMIVMKLGDNVDQWMMTDVLCLHFQRYLLLHSNCVGSNESWVIAIRLFFCYLQILVHGWCRAYISFPDFFTYIMQSNTFIVLLTWYYQLFISQFCTLKMIQMM